MVFKAFNDFIGPNSLIPTFLVFGAYLRLINTNVFLFIVS